MRSCWILVAIVATASALAGAAPRAGKVVRIARRAAGLSGHPRFCAVHPADMFGHCIGSRAPEIGERLIAIDNNRVLGVIRVISVDPYNDGCQQTSSWMIQTLVDSGDVRAARGTMLALADVPVDTHSGKLITVDKTPTGHTWGTDTIYAIDSNADGNPDVEFIQFPCDDSGNASLTATTGQCHEVWGNESGHGLERLRQDRIRTCY